MSKLEVALYAALFGWCLAQGTEALKSYLKIRGRKDAIIEEMFELQMLLKDGISSAKNTALSYGKAGNYSYTLGPELGTPVFDAFYHEVADKFTDWQRFNIRMFYSHLGFYNRLLGWVSDLKSGQVPKNEIVLKLFETYKQASIAHAFLEACNEKGGKEKLTESHPSLKALMNQIEEDHKKVTLVQS